MPVYQHILFGEPRIDAKLETFKLPVQKFEELEAKLRAHLGVRTANFHYTLMMFEQKCTALTELSVFLLIEELSILIKELSGQAEIRDLKCIYGALKLQAYAELRVVAKLVA